MPIPTLSYPLDLQTRTDLGHYMMFYVNVPNQTSYSTTNSMKVSTRGIKFKNENR